MTPPSNTELVLYDWLCLSAPELLARGADSQQRIHFTGHKSPLDLTWLPSLGAWSVLESHEIIHHQEPHLGLVKVRPVAYRQFKHRHGLLTGKEFVLLHGPEPWLRAELAYVAYIRRQAAFVRRNGVSASLGQVCRLIALHGQDRKAPPQDRLGMLPAELVLYVRLFRAFLRNAPYSAWHALEPNDKAATWAEGPPDHDKYGIELFATAPAVRDLADNDHADLQAVG